MKVVKRKNIDWNDAKLWYRLEDRLRRWLKRFAYRLLIRRYINEMKDDVIKSICFGGTFEDVEYSKEWVYAYKIIAMKYGLKMIKRYRPFDNRYTITLKKME